MSTFFVTTLAIGLSLKLVAAGNILRQEIQFGFIRDIASPGFGLYATTAYEKAMGIGACEKILFKCYECLEPCNPTYPKKIKFRDGSSLGIFRHEGTTGVGSQLFDNIAFDLIFESDPPPEKRTPMPVLGLADCQDEKYPSLMEQLIARSPKPIMDNVFALYLRPRIPPSSACIGELLFGGGDQSLYVKPLRLVPAIATCPWTVQLSAVHVEGGSKFGVGSPTFLDTGTNGIVVPQTKLIELVNSIQQRASKSAGREIEFDYDAMHKVYTFECDFRYSLPTLSFMLSSLSQEVPLAIQQMSYVARAQARCYLLMYTSPDGNWTLPGSVLFGNYFEFQVDKKMVGIAKLA
ncbi:hypothetical protein FOL47_007424 [Perkinsus chesapeaki]|uniref:Peptidase A1 domain-containing protein n=1 Tax=Perkinsus chesapeaki TaxID=330153 RepID=A0A7J6MVK3_PERCH|nr:hypothetical protein FOL47_007424 [Perkinsus chesapeaki]